MSEVPLEKLLAASKPAVVIAAEAVGVLQEVRICRDPETGLLMAVLIRYGQKPYLSATWGTDTEDPCVLRSEALRVPVLTCS